MEDACGRSPEKWWRKRNFSLTPYFEIKKANEHNASGFFFTWLFLTLSNGMTPHFGVDLYINDRVGARIGLPYLNIYLSFRILPGSCHFWGWRK